MKTLYLRNVPEHVAANLAWLAEREGISVNAFAVRELTAVARRAENAALLAELPDSGIPIEEIVAVLREDRASH